MDKELCIYFNFVVSGRNFNLEWTTLRLLLLHHPLTHPNLRPFITFLGVALACLLMALVGLQETNRSKLGLSLTRRRKKSGQE
ncbi:hypothetical protein S245_006095 [Arachis hypogaea]